MTPTNTFTVLHTKESTKAIANLLALSPPVTPSTIDPKSLSLTASRQKASGKPSPCSLKPVQVPDVSIHYQVVAESSCGSPKYLKYFQMTLNSKKCGSVKDTPLVESLKLTEQLGCEVSIKDETVLPGRSHMYRGAYNQIANLDPKVSWKGVITCSTGANGECVAFASCQLKVPAIIVMPLVTPKSLQHRMRILKATVVLAGKDFRDAQTEAERLTKLHELCLIANTSETLNLAGLGNIGVELGRQTDLMDVYAVFVPLSSAELVAGVGFYVRRVVPWVKIIAVALSNGCTSPSPTPRKQFLANLATSEEQSTSDVGPMPFPEMIDEVIQVTANDLSVAMQDCFENTYSFVKPSGAISLAGLKEFAKQRPEEVSLKRLVAIVSDGATTYDEVRFTVSQISEMTQQDLANKSMGE